MNDLALIVKFVADCWVGVKIAASVKAKFLEMVELEGEKIVRQMMMSLDGAALTWNLQELRLKCQFFENLVLAVAYKFLVVDGVS